MSKEKLLSICISTRNRGFTISNTLQSITSQFSEDIEVIIVDGNSSDDTEIVVNSFVNQGLDIYYHKETVNSGVDGDYDKSVKYASGKYCWLMTDDDVLKEGAIEYLLHRLRSDFDFYFIDTEVKNKDFSITLNKSRVDIKEDRSFSREQTSDLLNLIGSQMSYIGSVIIRREFWLKRDRESFYGSLFIHVGVLLQSPKSFSTLVISKSLIIIRAGNANWTPRWFEVWMFLWPNLIWSFEGLTEDEKKSVTPEYPWKSLKKLLYTRAVGSFSRREYYLFLKDFKLSDRLNSIFVLLIPAKILNFFLVIFLYARKKTINEEIYYLLISNNCIESLRNYFIADE
ncbi:glycosyltransferase family 2 protein [Gammaproteobacteria bacterium]|nr:glycosyltransferase family 2 protein [Gammaproteobacteria bacterium]